MAALGLCCRVQAFSRCGAKTSLLWWILLLHSMGSRAHRLSCPAARQIFPNQGLNPCPQHCKADSQPLDHQEVLQARI